LHGQALPADNGSVKARSTISCGGPWQAVVLAVVTCIAVGAPAPLRAQAALRSPAPPRVLTIPYLANASRPDDLDFTAAQCDISANREQMQCRFRQVFLTPTSIDPTTCAITTSGYERAFSRETATRWVSRTSPEGSCGLIETTTLEDGGGTRWTMSVRSEAMAAAGRPECRASSPDPELYDWRRMKRKLPCTSIQPGAIER
jgi:hypothetical protein